MHRLLSYKGAPGSSGQPDVRWPQEAPLSHSSEHATLIVFAHPRCPCSRATLSELETVLARAQHPFDTQVVFYRPAHEPDSWAQTALYRKASTLPGVKVLIDPEGAVARQFGAETSGHAVVFNRKGGLLFSGGITGSRGHAGENAGTANVLAAIDGDPVWRSQTDVFGCRLTD